MTRRILSFPFASAICLLPFVAALLAVSVPVMSQGTSTTSTRILAANGPAFVTFYYQPALLVWEAKLTCNEYTGLLTLQFIQPQANEPDTNTTFSNACTLTGAGTKDVTVTTTATPDTSLTFVDHNGHQQAITALSWKTTCESTRTGCNWTSPSANGMTVNYQQ